MKAYKKYKCEMINNGENQKFSHFKKWILSDLQSTMDIYAMQNCWKTP